MPARSRPRISQHRSKDAEEHLLALGADFKAVNESYSKSHSQQLPTKLAYLITKGISQGLAEASSVGYCLSLTSESDRELLCNILLKHITTQAAAKARDRVPLDVYSGLAESYSSLLPKVLEFTTAQKLLRMKRASEGRNAQQLGLPPSAVAQEVPNLEDNDARTVSKQEGQVKTFAKDATQDDSLDKDGRKGADEAKEVEKGKDEAEGEEWKGNTGEVNNAKKPREPALNNDVYDPEKAPYHYGPLKHKFPVTFRITSQAIVNALYDMNPWQMREAVCGAIRKKQTHTRSFEGASYLSDVSLSSSGDISAVTNNEKWNDLLLLIQMSNWDRDIIDHGIGMNFGSHRCYRVHMKGVKKDSSLSGDLGSRKEKAALISELVRINTTTLISLRIHHIKDVYYIRSPGKGNEVLAVDFFDIEQANAALWRGLYYKGNRYDCETVEKHRFLARCKNCQAFGHKPGPHCGPLRCGRCSDAHRTENCCISREERCALCAGPHASDNPDCPVTKAENNSIRFSTVSSRNFQSMTQPETAVPALVLPEHTSFSNDALTQSSEPICGLQQDTRKLLTEIPCLRQLIQGLEVALKAKRRNIKRGPTKKKKKEKRALDSLTNGAFDDPGRSAKRIKREEQQQAETMDLYRIPSPYIVHRD